MSILGKVTDDGHIICPSCGVGFITPKILNPYNGNVEKMVIDAGMPYVCTICGNVFTVTEQDARWHNHFWFPHDPEFKLGVEQGERQSKN